MKLNGISFLLLITEIVNVDNNLDVRKQKYRNVRFSNIILFNIINRISIFLAKFLFIPRISVITESFCA